MTRHLSLACVIFVSASLFLLDAPEAQAAWGYSDIYYNGSTTVEGYSATIRDWWDSDWQQCADWQYDSGSAQWYCALAYYNAYWVSIAASLQGPSGTVWSGSTWDPWGAGVGTVVASDYGSWAQFGAHYMGDDVSYNQCWNAYSCSGWQFDYVTWWSLGYSSLSTYVAPPAPAPDTPANPSPANGATNVTTIPTLSWSAAGATSYDVAFGTANPPPTVATNLTSASYALGSLNTTTAYYWQITARNSSGSTPGPVWSFTTLRQPTSFTLSASEGYAGIDCYTMTAGNAANMLLDLTYTYNGGPQSTTSVQLNGNGQWSYCLGHYDQTGLYQFWDMKNNAASSWAWISPARPAPYTVRPPQPTSLSISPAAITRGQSYTMTVGNGALITMAEQYTLNGASQSGSVSLDAQSSGSATGVKTINTDSATVVGKYVFTAVKNTLNTSWATLSASITICPAEVPAIQAISPSAGSRGSAVTVTITGSNLCAPAFAATSGVTFSNIVANAPFTSMTATFTIASSATEGPRTIQLSTPAGSASATFTITPTMSLTKEYIYLGSRIIAVTSPADAPPPPPAPDAPANPAPANSATNVTTTPTLGWTAGGATSYDVAFGTANPPPTVATNLSSASYTTGTLSTSTTYYWKVTAKNSAGSTLGPAWSFTTAAPPFSASGGTVTTSGGYTIHTFTSSGTFTPNGNGTVEVLVVAGGGGGGYERAGGGGAGAVVQQTITVAPEAYPVAVGAGGAGSTSGGSRGGNGANSSISIVVAQGGGGGGSGNGAAGGSDGGSGGGGAWTVSSGAFGGGSGVSGKGNAGGTGVSNDNNRQGGGGGGGRGSAGSNAGTSGGNGGSGFDSGPFRGTGTNLIAGGGGGGIGYLAAGSGGTGQAGGGNGGKSIGQAGGNATANTGSGGGGGGSEDANGGNGGSGIVIVRYATP